MHVILETMELTSNWKELEGCHLTPQVSVCVDATPDAVPDEVTNNPWFVLRREECDDSCSIIVNPNSASAVKCNGENRVQGRVPSQKKSSGGNQAVTSLAVAVDAELVEVFVGKHEEYHGSFYGMPVEHLRDSGVFWIYFKLAKPQPIVTLVFKKLFNENNLSVYGIYSRVVEAAQGDVKSAGTAGRFSSQFLNSVISQHGLSLSEDAETFKQVLQNYNDKLGSSGAGAAAAPSLQLAGLLPLFAGVCSAGLLGNVTSGARLTSPPSEEHVEDAELETSGFYCGASTGESSSHSNSPSNSDDLQVSEGLCRSETAMDVSSGEPPLNYNSTSYVNDGHLDGAFKTSLLKQHLDNILQTKLNKINERLDIDNCGNVLQCRESGVTVQHMAVLEAMIDKKLTAFEARIERLLEQKFAAQTSVLMKRLGNVENELNGSDITLDEYSI